MILTFLDAADGTPLTKALSPSSKSPYPNIYEVTSHAKPCQGITDFHRLVSQFGPTGSCLLKGGLDRPLVSESRAGHTDPNAPTSWLCLDLDGADYPAPDHFMGAIGLGSVSYVCQWSASQGVFDTLGTKSSPGLRCHLFVLLEKPHIPAELKRWLQHLNLTVSGLSSGLALSSTAMALRWPLDVSTCQNDKLIYIAPPKLSGGLVDPFPGPQRYVLNLRATDVATLPQIASEGEIRALMDAKLEDLRSQAGLEKRKNWNLKFKGAIDYLPKPDVGRVSTTKHERGFTYLNINGGDSFAYYHPDNNPKFIFNFKGEPNYLTEELLPEYWRTVKDTTGVTAPNGKIYLAFRDFEDANYYNGVYDPESQDLKLRPAKGLTQLRDFLLDNKQMPPEHTPDWQRVFEPNNPLVVDIPNRRVNTFNPSPIMKAGYVKGMSMVPPGVNLVVSHIVGNDPHTRDWVYNWLAYIAQRRTKSGAALVCHGAPGTGKGIFYHHIITPIFGHDNVCLKRLEEMESDFTGWVENKLFVFVDEVKTSSSLYHSKVNAKLKSLITEPTMPVRHMYSPVVMKPNFANYMFASNELDPVDVKDGDRRYTVGFRQIQPLIDLLPNGATPFIQGLSAELPDFYGFLMNHQVDEAKACMPLVNDAKAVMQETNRTAIDAVVHALQEGDQGFFVDQLPMEPLPEVYPRNKRNQTMAAYCAFISDLLRSQEKHLTRDELQLICRFCAGDNIPDSPHKFTAMMRHHNINMKYVRRDGRTVRGIDVTWKADPKWVTQTIIEVQPLLDSVRGMGY